MNNLTFGAFFNGIEPRGGHQKNLQDEISLNQWSKRQNTMMTPML